MRLDTLYQPVKKIRRGKNKYSIIDGDNNPLSEVSKRYTIVQNRDIFKPFVDTFGADNIKSFYAYGNRKYYHMAIDTGRTFNLGTEVSPDMIKERIVIQNSYNKTRSFCIMMGAFRWVCTNGLYSGKADVTYKKIHVGRIPIKSIVNKALKVYNKNNFETWQQMADKKLSLDQQMEALNLFKCFDEHKNGKDIWRNKQLNRRINRRAEYLLRLPESIDNARNAWGLYNQINASIYKAVSGRSQINKRITANNKAEQHIIQSVLN
jgi:hypothetical protein